MDNNNFGRDQFNIYGPKGSIEIGGSEVQKDIAVAIVGDQPPSFERYWVDRPSYQALLTDRLNLNPVTEIVAEGGFGKSSLAAWGYENLGAGFKKQFFVRFERPKSFVDFARWVLQEIGFRYNVQQPTEAMCLDELLFRLSDRNAPIKILLVMDQVEAIAEADDWQWFQQFLEKWAAEGKGSRVLVTTRSQVLSQAPIALGGMDQAEGAVFFGREGLTGDRFADLIDLAGGHPLLLKLAASWTKETYGGQVDDGAIDFFGKLFANYEGDPKAGVGAIFGVIFEALPITLRELLCGLSVYRLPFGVAMAQAIDGATTIADLVLLGDRGLLLGQGEGWTLHPLVAGLVRSRVMDDQRWEAHEGAIGYFVLNLKIGDKTIEGSQEVFEISYHLCQLARYSLAYDLVNACIDQFYREGYYREIVNLYEPLTHEWSLEEHIDSKNLPKLGWAFNILGAAYRSLGEYQKSVYCHHRALTIQRKVGDREGEGGNLCNLGYAYESLGDYQQAITYYEESLLINREVGNRSFEANCLGNLGSIYGYFDEYHKAIQYHEESLKIKRAINDRDGEGGGLCNLGLMYSYLGQYTKAVDLYKKALEIQREVGNRQFESNALGNLGDIHHTMKEYESSIEFYQLSLELQRAIEDRRGEAKTLEGLGNVYQSLEQYQKAIDLHQKSIEIKREIKDWHGEGISLGNLGITYAALGEYQRATDFYQQSLRIKREIGDRDGEGRSLFNLAKAESALNNTAQAILNFQQAQSIYEDLEIDHMVEQCKEGIHISKRSSSNNFWLWFAAGLLFVILIYWLKR